MNDLDQPITLLEQHTENGPYFLCRNGVALNCPHLSPTITQVWVEKALSDPTGKPLEAGQIQIQRHKLVQCGTHCALFSVENHDGEIIIDQNCAHSTYMSVNIKPFKP